MLTRLALSWVLVAACCSSAGDRRPGAFSTSSLGEPVRVARVWTTALAPNKRGGWNFITQTYEFESGKPTELVVLDLETGKQSLSEGPATIFANSNYQIAEQLRAPNGRIFFPQIENQMAFYDPVDETVKQMGKIVDGDDKMIFRVVFGPDGKLYGGTQSYGRPTVFQLDPDTLKARVIGKVGRNRSTFSYAYYLAVDPPWLYVAVGQSPWDLAAIHIETGEHRILASRADGGFMQLDVRPQGITATLISGLNTPQQKIERVWCADGKTFAFGGGIPPFPPRNVKPRDNPIAKPPQLDLSEVNPDGQGIGRIAWRPNGSTGPWKTTSYKVKYTTPVDIDSLLPLPDGTVLGSAKQYHGYFRFNPKDRSFKRFGSFKLSGGARAQLNGLIYLAGYPNGSLYVYDPKKPWTTTARSPISNPTHLGNFTQTGTHYAYFLLPARNRRLYYAGRRERTGVGGGIGYYEPATKTFVGHHEQLSFLSPQGLAVFDDLERVVYSGRLGDDPARPGQSPVEAQLVVYNLGLQEIERLTVKPGLRNTGLVFVGAPKHVIVGVAAAERAIYRYDLVARKLLDWEELNDAVGPVTRREADGSIWMVVGAELFRVDPATLAMTSAGKLAHAPTPNDLLAWQNDRLYWATRSELREIAVP